MAQLVERLLPIPEVRNSNPVIGNIYIEHLFTINCIENIKINKKRPGMANFFLKKIAYDICSRVGGHSPGLNSQQQKKFSSKK